MMDWIMQRFGASIEELAREQYEELMGFDPIDPEAAASISKGHKPPRHDIGKLKQLYDIYSGTFDEDAGRTGPPRDPEKKAQWDELVQMNADESEAARVHANVVDLISDPATTGFVTEEDDPFQTTVEVMSGKHRYWNDILDLAFRNNYTGELTPESKPLWTEEEARKLLSSALRKKQIAEAPRVFGNIRDALGNLLHNAPESYKLWPWMVKQLKDPAFNQNYGGISHMVDVVSGAGKVIAEERRQNRLPQNFDINKMGFEDLENWFMQWKRENRESEDQGEVVYQWDDGWTMQRLTNEEQLQFEGDSQGHCVGDYQHAVESGASIIYSLRDPKGNPHVTIEMEGPDLHKKLSDKPASEIDPDERREALTNPGGDISRHDEMPLFEDAQDRQDYHDYTGMGVSNRWPKYLTSRGRVTPHDAQDDAQYYNQQGIPWDKSFYVVQVQGNSNHTPKPEYQTRVKEFMDYLKSKGFSFQRSGDWYPNQDGDGEETLDGAETYGEWVENQFGRGHSDPSVLDWYTHYQQNPNIYIGGNEDTYGIKQAQKYSGFPAEEAIGGALDQVLENGEDPAEAARAMLHYVMLENFQYTDIDKAVRHAENQLQAKANDENDHNWETENGTWMYTNPDTGQDEEVEDYNDLPEDSFFNTHEDPKYADGWKFINALDQYLDWYYKNKKKADADRHPNMKLPKIDWQKGGTGLVSGTDPYESEEAKEQVAQQAQQDAGPGFSTTDLNGVFSRVKTAETEHDPDYSFVYYMSELRVEPWDVNLKHEKVFEALLNDFNVDLGNSAMDIDPADVAAGEIRIRKGKPEIEHQQLCPPEIREQAEDAIGQWWAKQWFDGLEHDWYSPDERHTL